MGHRLAICSQLQNLKAPAVGAVVMSVSTIVVALNAQLLRRLDLRPEHIEETLAKHARSSEKVVTRA